jgi:hypothetical protein
MQYTVLLGDDKTDRYVITVEMKKVVNPLVLDQTPFLLVTLVALLIFFFFPNQMIWAAVERVHTALVRLPLVA